MSTVTSSDVPWPWCGWSVHPTGGLMINKYGKAIAAVVGATLVVVHAALSDQRITAEEWVQVAIAGVTAVGVYLVPLAPKYRWGKSAVAVLLAVLQALTTVILGGLDTREVIVLVLAGLTAAGVVVAPAVSDNGIGSKDPRVPGRMVQGGRAG